MNSIFTFNSGNGNSYLLDIEKNSLIYLHPILQSLINNNGILDLSDLSKNIHVTASDIAYYKKKYNLLKISNCLNRKQKQSAFNKINPDVIENILANLKQITIEVTESCNLNCRYCGYGTLYTRKVGRSNRNLDYDHVIVLINYLRKFWESPLNKSKRLCINIGFYGGEPLLNMELINKIILYTKEIEDNKIYFTYNMTTNALMILNYIDFLVEKKIHLLVSLDGDEACNKYRIYKSGKESFQKVYENIKIIQNKYPNYFKNYVEFNSVLHNCNSIARIHNFFSKEFDKIANITEVKPYGILEERKAEFIKMYKNWYESLNNTEDFQKIIKERFISTPLVKDVSMFIFFYSGNVFDNYSLFLKPDNKRNLIYTGTCLPFAKKIFLTADGKIFPCERIDNKYVLGEIKNKKVNLDLSSVAEKYNSFYTKIQKQCFICYRWKDCHQCIFQIENLSTCPKCDFFVNKEKMNRYLADQVTFLENYPYLYLKILKEVVIKD